MAKCNICGCELKFTEQSICGGHGDFYHAFELSCPCCHITVKGDDYFTRRDEDAKKLVRYRFEHEHYAKTVDVIAQIRNSEVSKNDT